MSIRDGGFDSASFEYVFAVFTIFSSPAARCKCGYEELSLFSTVFFSELIFDSHICQESLPLPKTPNLLLNGRREKSCTFVDDEFSESIQEVISVGRGTK